MSNKSFSSCTNITGSQRVTAMFIIAYKLIKSAEVILHFLCNIRHIRTFIRPLSDRTVYQTFAFFEYDKQIFFKTFYDAMKNELY